MSRVLNTTATMIRICANSRRSWNADIKESRKVFGRTKLREQNSEEATWAKVELQTLIQQSKSPVSSDYFQNLCRAEMSRAAQYTNPRAGITMEVPTDCEAKQAYTAMEK